MEPIVDQIDSREDCTYLLQCLFGMSEMENRCYKYIYENGPVGTAEIADAVERDESTVNRCLQRLADAGLIESETVPYDGGGYKYVYKQVSPQEAREEMEDMIDEWVEQTKGLLEQFEEDFS